MKKIVIGKVDPGQDVPARESHGSGSVEHPPSERAEFVPVRPRDARVIACLGDDAADDAVLRWVAHHLAGREAAVLLLHVLDASGPVRLERAQTVLAHAADLVHGMAPALEVAVAVRTGDAAEEILESRGALLALGVRGSTDESGVLGRLAAASDRPVVVVPADWTGAPGPVVVGVAADVASDAAVAFATTEADRLGVELVVVHVAEPGAPEDAGARLVEESVLDARRLGAHRVRGTAPHGIPVDTLRELARDASLLVVGRRPRSRLERWLLGSTSRSLLASPPVPVAIVPPPAHLLP